MTQNSCESVILQYNCTFSSEEEWRSYLDNFGCCMLLVGVCRQHILSHRKRVPYKCEYVSASLRHTWHCTWSISTNFAIRHRLQAKWTVIMWLRIVKLIFKLHRKLAKLMAGNNLKFINFCITVSSYSNIKTGVQAIWSCRCQLQRVAFKFRISCN